MYKSFMSSNFSYCPVSWIFCGKPNSDKLEKLQERALLFVFSDYMSPYRELLKHGHFLSLSALRIRYLAVEMYKCVHGLNPPYLNELFKSKDTRYHFRDSNCLQQPEFQTVRYGFKSFHYYGSNRGTHSQQRLRSLKIYTTLRKTLLNGAHRLNVMCSSYNDIHDIYVCIYVMYIYIYALYICLYITLNEIYHIILSVLSIAEVIIQLHVRFIEPSRFICEIHDEECIVYI